MSSFHVLFVVSCFCAALGVGMASDCPVELCEGATRRDASVLFGEIGDGVDVCTCVCDDTGTTLLHLAAQFEAVTFAQELIQGEPFQCSGNVTDINGDTPLHTTSRFCQSPMNALCLKLGADPTTENADGLTPLCLAAKTDDSRCGGLINQYIDIGGVDICDRCNDLLPRELAYMYGNENVHNILLQREYGGSEDSCGFSSVYG